MPQAVFAGPLIAAGVTAGTAFAVAAVIQTVLINVALGALAKALSKSPKVQVPPINVSIRNPVANRRLVFGRVRTGGVFAFVQTSSDEPSDNKYLWYVVVMTGHQASAITDVWLDKQRLANSIIGGGAVGGGAVTTGVFANKLWIYKFHGTSAQNVNPELNAAIPSIWDANHRLKGCAGVVVKMERDDEKYPQGAPSDVTALVDGALCYDSRLDSTNGGSGTHRRTDPRTWEFTRNPALHWRWFVSGGSVHNDTSTRLIKYGLKENDARIPDSFVAAAANICDETLSGANATPEGEDTRYLCDLEVSTGETRREILEAIMATFAATHTYVHGQHRIYAGAYDAPAHSFNERDLYGDLEIEDTVDHSKRHNAVAGVFRDWRKEYVEQTTIFRTDSAYEVQDGGRRIPIEIDLRGVTDQYQAQRLCEIKLRKSRMMRTVKLVGALNLLKVAQNETISYSHARYNWNGRTFLCIERELDFSAEAGRVVLTCTREDAAVYNDLLTTNYTTGTSETDTFANETPDPPTNLRSKGLLNAILWQWNAPAVAFPGTTYESRFSTASAMTSPTTDYSGADIQIVQERTVTDAIYRQVRSVRNKVPSPWHPLTNGVSGQASAVALALGGSVSPGLAESNTGSANQTTNSVTVTPSGGTSPYTYAWTWLSGGASITITSPTAVTTTFSTTGIAEGTTRSGVARCTITDNVAATKTVDVDVNITRPAAEVTAPLITLFGRADSPTDASAAFKLDADGHWYSSETTAAPTTDRGLWANPVDYAANYAVRITRTAGETAFTSGPALNTWHAMTTDREWRMTATTIPGVKSITFTIEIRRVSDSVVVSTSTGNTCAADQETAF